jgi:DNA-binding transcriptional LysR family regulator
MIFDFRLKVFYTVAEKLSFTKAAAELFITQPAVTKHINELETQLETRLFVRNGSSIALTPSGEMLLKYARRIFKLYVDFENELSQLKDVSSGVLKIGASTTLAQYVLPGILAVFKRTYPAIHIHLIIGNTAFVEQQLIAQQIDMALVEGISRHQQLHYEPFVKDEIVLVARTGNKLFQKNEIKAEHLLQVPLVFREPGSGTLDVIHKALQKSGINPQDLWVDIHLDSTESIKQYILNAECAAFLSIHAIGRELRQNELTVIDIKGVDIFRTFQFIQLHGQAEKLPALFKRFCQNHYNFK